MPLPLEKKDYFSNSSSDSNINNSNLKIDPSLPIMKNASGTIYNTIPIIIMINNNNNNNNNNFMVIIISNTIITYSIKRL